MNTMSISKFRKNVYNVVKSVIKTQESVTITNRNFEDSAVLISRKHWEDIQETLFLYANKDTRERIISALKQPIEDGEELNWKNGE
jgi:prevent-host-death family protein